MSAGKVVSCGAALQAEASPPTGLLAHVDPVVRRAAVALPDAENALPMLKQAAKLMTDVPDGDFEYEDCFSTDKPDAELDRKITGWLDQHQQIIPLVEQAVARGKLEFPATPWIAERIDELDQFRFLARFFLLETQRRISGDKLVEAAHASRVSYEAFRLVEAGGGFNLDCLVAIACEGCSWPMLQQIATHPQADARLVRRMLADLPARSDPLAGTRRSAQTEFCHFFLPIVAKLEGASLAKAIELILDWNEGSEEQSSRVEYLLQRDKLAQLFAGHPNPFGTIDTLQRASARSAAAIRDLDVPWPTLRARPAPRPSNELAAWPEHLTLYLPFGDSSKMSEVTDAQIQKSRKKLLRVKNPIGKMLLRNHDDGASLLHVTALRRHAHYEAVRLFLAIRIFALEHGALPPALDALVGARIVDTLPLDPFAAKPFQYSPARRAFWSVDQDGMNSPSPPGEMPEFELCVWRLDACLS